MAGNSPDIKPPRRRSHTAAPQLLDLRPGHIKAVAAARAKQAQAKHSVTNQVKSIDSVARPAKATVKVTKPAAKPSVKPASSPVTKSIVKPDIKPATKRTVPAAKPVSRPTATATKPVSKATKTNARSTTKTSRTKSAPTAPAKQQAATSTTDAKLSKLANQGRRRLDKTTASIIGHCRKFILDRWDHIRLARRDVVIWLCLVLALIVGSFAQSIWYGSQVTTTAAAAGGTYAEGVVDKLTTISPLYANTATEQAASQLVYPGLLAYDEANKLTGALAETWSVDDSGKIWTVHLKPDLAWSDGQPLTAEDVVMTVKLMQNSQVSTSLSSSWQNITVQATDDRTITFTLPAVLMSFDTSLTFGILPKHVLEGKTALQISDLFIKNPEAVVGAGPFVYDSVETVGGQSIWHFKPNSHYCGGQPQLSELVIHTYASNDELLASLQRGEVNAISSVKVSDLSHLDRNKFKVVQLKTADGVYAIFNTDGELTSNDTIRNALRLGLNRSALRDELAKVDGRLSKPAALETPIAPGVYDSIDQLKQPDYSQQQAASMLDQAGWTIAKGAKYRTKGDQRLDINIVTIADTNYATVADLIAKQWQALGINATVKSVSASQAQQNYLMPRNYDVLVYQMHLGTDPDVYAFWSPTQISSTGLNYANYSSRRAELALAAGRTNVNPAAREARYQSFVEMWLKDNPAIALYQPSLIEVMADNVDTLRSGNSLLDASNRFHGATDWTVNTRSVMTTP